MRPLTRPIGARVVQILGGIGNPNAEKHASRLVNRLAELLHGTAILLPAPGVVGSAESRQVLLSDPFTREAMNMFEEITLALVGIGSVEPSKLLSASGNVFDRSELDRLSEHGAVGDMLLRFVDSEGKRIVSELDQRVIGMDLEQLRNVPRVVGIASGERKVPAIKGVLKGRWINVLITDRFTAERLLDRR